MNPLLVLDYSSTSSLLCIIVSLPVFHSVVLVLMCVNPFQVKVTSRSFGVSRYVDAPCGHCVECLKRRQNDWKLRLVHESSYWSNLFFFTLTYSNKSLPCRVDYSDLAVPDVCPLFVGSYDECKVFADDDMTIRSTACKSHIQKFLKRLRINYQRKHGVPLEMKYFICSEYGPNPNGTKRPHYHGLLMTNASYFDLLPEFNEWKRDYGRMEFKQVGYGRDQSSKVANYISKYCAKGCFQSRLDDIYSGFIENAWYVMSKNIGLRWFEENKFQWLKYVPSCRTIVGDWTYEDVERFFSSGTDKSVLCAQEIDALLDNFFVIDGDSFSYKMPRYYRERLLCVRKTFTNPSIFLKNGKPVPCITPLKSFLQSSSSEKYEFRGCSPVPYSCVPEPITYETFLRKDVRYVSENFLSVAFAYRLSLRIADCYQKKFEGEKGVTPSLSDTEVHLRLLSQRENSLKYREQMSTQGLCDFYNSNMWKHREFDFECSGEFNYNITSY